MPVKCSGWSTNRRDHRGRFCDVRTATMVHVGRIANLSNQLMDRFIKECDERNYFISQILELSTVEIKAMALESISRALMSATRDERLYEELARIDARTEELRDSVHAVLDSLRDLGVPNYAAGSALPEERLADYTWDDVRGLRQYLWDWGLACSEERQSIVPLEGCNCAECQFFDHRITYGSLLHQRAARTNAPVRNPGNEAMVARNNDPARRIRDRRIPRAEPTVARTLRSVPTSYTRRLDVDLSQDVAELDIEDFRRPRYDAAASYGIQAWNYKFPVEFKGTSPFGTFFGFELEISADYSTAAAVAAIDYIGSTKWDGSIRGNGYEIVSHPMSWDLVKDESFDWIPELRANGAKAGRNGLHVHISRSGFASDWHRWKYIRLWMDPANYTEVKAFNRRHSTNYASPRTRLTNYRMARRVNVEEGSRYCLINVQNSDTIEMRGPASTLDRRKLKGTIAGFAASAEYTRIMSSTAVALGGLQWEAFVSWASEQDQYGEFMEYLDLLVREGAPPSVRGTHDMSFT